MLEPDGDFYTGDSISYLVQSRLAAFIMDDLDPWPAGFGIAWRVLCR